MGVRRSSLRSRVRGSDIWWVDKIGFVFVST